MMQTRMFNGTEMNLVTLKLGQVVFIRGWYGTTACKFIKVTPKGFNFLNVKTNKCIYKSHFYDRKYRGVLIPGATKTFRVWAPSTVEVRDD